VAYRSSDGGAGEVAHCASGQAASIATANPAQAIRPGRGFCCPLATLGGVELGNVHPPPDLRDVIEPPLKPGDDLLPAEIVALVVDEVV